MVQRAFPFAPGQRAIAAERRRARTLHIPDAAIARFVATYRARGMSELEALRKLNADIVRDRGRWQGGHVRAVRPVHSALLEGRPHPCFDRLVKLAFARRP
ncbi:hypothetical protein roselon_01707 [Roseibacterium elongatum DSM 19469]|uniref:Uncharacterized protein n=1 Tax=Roseicyclus elongatus DSM 19469 TaxID=1294273 RepID=W8S5G7_9RHOB|nr:hypothetical protein roselon_01707 [Roseibacterium elongatum DSM 19469]